MDYTYIKGKIRPWRPEEKEKYFSKKKKEKTKEMKYWRYIALDKHVKESNASHSLEIKKLKR